MAFFSRRRGLRTRIASSVVQSATPILASKWNVDQSEWTSLTPLLLHKRHENGRRGRENVILSGKREFSLSNWLMEFHLESRKRVKKKSLKIGDALLVKEHQNWAVKMTGPHQPSNDVNGIYSHFTDSYFLWLSKYKGIQVLYFFQQINGMFRNERT